MEPLEWWKDTSEDHTGCCERVGEDSSHTWWPSREIRRKEGAGRWQGVNVEDFHPWTDTDFVPQCPSYSSALCRTDLQEINLRSNFMPLSKQEYWHLQSPKNHPSSPWAMSVVRQNWGPPSPRSCTFPQPSFLWRYYRVCTHQDGKLTGRSLWSHSFNQGPGVFGLFRLNNSLFAFRSRGKNEN